MKDPSTNERLTGKRDKFTCIAGGMMELDTVSNDGGAPKTGLAKRLRSRPSGRQ